jgi:glycosyltransferase involved in cell wall biosynthesis
MDRLDLCLCVSTRNAAADLPGCIDSVRDWVSEIVVVDMESSDDTRSIARSYGATVVEVAAAGWTEPGRQSGIEAATRPWILVLDSDERAAAGMREVVARYVGQDEVAGVWLPRQNFQFGWWMPNAGNWPDWQLRLFAREHTHWPGHRTHVSAQVDGRCERAPMRTENAIVHHSFASVSEVVVKTNGYTDLEVDRYERDGVRPTLTRLFLLPLARFLDQYVRHRGYRGGRYGLSLALMSWVYWLTAEIKLWERGLSRESLPAGSIPIDADAAVGDPSTARNTASPRSR